jgi:two-component system OmpR family sensor kinase
MRPIPIAWDAPRAIGDVIVDAASKALRMGGIPAFEVQRASWPADIRGRLTMSAADACPAPADSRAIAVLVESASERYCLRYATPSLPSDSGGAGQRGIPFDYLFGTALAGILFSAALAWYVISPIRRLERAFDQVAKGDLDVRLGPGVGRRRDEVASLAHHFDRMAEQLGELVASRDRLLHDVSHELRSPLARMRLAVDLLRRDPGRLQVSLDRIDREADNLDALVGELLTLAKLESGADQEPEYFDLQAVLNLVVEDVRFEAKSSGVEIDVHVQNASCGPSWVIAGSGLLIRRAIENILRNALRFSNPGHIISVVLSPIGTQGILTIEDEGPGVDEGARSDLLKPFVTGPGAGFGLGLAIAQRAIATCGGVIAIANRAPRGLRVQVSLPLSLATTA